MVCFYKEVQHIRRKEGWEGWAKQNILDSQMKQCQQNADCFLLVPAENHRKRKIVDTAAKGFRLGDGYFDRTVSVVALAHIQ